MPVPRTYAITDGETTFKLLESADVDDGGVLYALALRGPAFDTAYVAGVYVPTAAAHPDPLYLWQLIKTYSGRAFLPPCSGPAGVGGGGAFTRTARNVPPPALARHTVNAGRLSLSLLAW